MMRLELSVKSEQLLLLRRSWVVYGIGLNVWYSCVRNLTWRDYPSLWWEKVRAYYYLFTVLENIYFKSKFYIKYELFGQNYVKLNNISIYIVKSKYYLFRFYLFWTQIYLFYSEPKNTQTQLQQLSANTVKFVYCMYFDFKCLSWNMCFNVRRLTSFRIQIWTVSLCRATLYQRPFEHVLRALVFHYRTIP